MGRPRRTRSCTLGRSGLHLVSVDLDISAMPDSFSGVPRLEMIGKEGEKGRSYLFLSRCGSVPFGSD